MKKTRKINKRRNRTYAKKGGKKNNMNMSRITTQMVGGQTPAAGPAPQPAPSPASVNINLDYPSVVTSLQTFGDTVWKLKEATDLGKQAAHERVLAAQADETALQSLNTAAQALYNSFFGTGSGASATRGLFSTIVPSATFTPPPSAPPSP